MIFIYRYTVYSKHKGLHSRFCFLNDKRGLHWHSLLILFPVGGMQLKGADDCHDVSNLHPSILCKSCVLIFMCHQNIYMWMWILCVSVEPSSKTLMEENRLCHD